MINVLMCTYNGEKYIREQLNSILAQSYDDYRVYIRDDGSTDNTPLIIQEYADSNKGRVFVIETSEHLGYPDCFWDLLTRCPKADYYAFADQDDVWKSDKLISMIDRFNDKQAEDDSPLLYIHDYDNCDALLKRMSVHRLGSTGIMNERSILFYTYASGFSMAINNGMRNMLNSMTLIGKGMYHDELCIWLAYFCGHIVYDDRVLVKYRRHEATVTEYGNGTSTLISNWIRREIKGDEFVWKCERIRSFLEMMKDKNVISDKILHEWSLLSGLDMTFTKYWKRILYPHRLRPSLGGELALRLLFLSVKGTCK